MKGINLLVKSMPRTKLQIQNIKIHAPDTLVRPLITPGFFSTYSAVFLFFKTKSPQLLLQGLCDGNCFGREGIDRMNIYIAMMIISDVSQSDSVVRYVDDEGETTYLWCVSETARRGHIFRILVTKNFATPWGGDIFTRLDAEMVMLPIWAIYLYKFCIGSLRLFYPSAKYLS